MFNKFLYKLSFFIFGAYIILILNRILNYVQILLPGFIFIFCGILLFITEIISIKALNKNQVQYKTDKTYYWGDKETFKFDPKRNDPIISRGGRLKSNLKINMYSIENKDGVSLITNSNGLRNETDYNRFPKKNTIRILNLGDSFSIGYMVDQKNFLGYKLQSILKKKLDSINIEVLNAEISDPAHAAYFLEKYYNLYNPNIIIYGIGNNDIMQSDLFLNKNSLFEITNEYKIKKNPNFKKNFPNERFFSYAEIKNTRQINLPKVDFINSKVLINWTKRFNRFTLSKKISNKLKYFLKPKSKYPTFSMMKKFEEEDKYKRLIDGSSYFGYFYNIPNKKITKMYDRFFELISSINKKCIKEKSEFVLLIFPHRFQIEDKEWDFITKKYNFDKENYDLELMNKKIKEYCTKQNINLVDPLPNLIGKEMDLYLDYDNHINSLGHELISFEVANHIIEIIDKPNFKINSFKK